MTARLVDICFVMVAAWSSWKVVTRPAPTPRRRHRNVRGVPPVLPRVADHAASAPRMPLSIVAGGDEYDLAVWRFEQARQRCSTWEPGR